MRPGPDAGRFLESEVTPLVVNGVMYLATPYERVVADQRHHRQRDMGL